jgi:hypothetical protein
MAWIGVDLDGTLAHYGDWKGIDHIGKPIPLMLARVKRWITEGKTVKIFTARACRGEEGIKPVREWLKEAGLPEDMVVTNQKDFGMISCWDDRAVQVIPNTGRRADGGEK